MAALPPRLRRIAAAAAALVIALATSWRVAAQAHRVVSIVPATTEMLFAMGAGDRVVAVGTYDHFPREADRLPHVGALLDPDVERIIALRPDLVVLYGTQTALRAELDRAHIPYYPYLHSGLPDVAETIRSLGTRVGVTREAGELAARIERQLAEVGARVAGRTRPRTLLVFGREPGSLRNIDASGGTGFLNDVLEAAGGTNVLGDVKQQSVATSTEMILTRAPEAIIELRSARTGQPIQPDVRAWSALPSVPAVRNRRVYVLEGEELVVPGPRIAAATERISKILHPEVW